MAFGASRLARALGAAAVILIVLAGASTCDSLGLNPAPEKPLAPVGSQIIKPREQRELISPGHLERHVERPSTPACRPPIGLTLDRSNRLLAACSLFGEIQLIDPESLSVLETWGPFYEYLFKVDVVPGDTYVVAVGMAGSFFYILDRRTGRLVNRVNVGRKIADMKRIPTRSQYLVAATNEQKVCVVDPFKAKILREYEFPEPIGYLAVGKNGRIAAATGGVYAVTNQGSEMVTGKVFLFDPRKQAPPMSARTLTAGLQAREPVFIRNDSMLLVPNFGDGTISVFDATTQEYFRRLDVQDGPERIIVGPEGKSAYCLNTRAASISVIQLSPLSVQRDIMLPANPENAVVSPDGKMLIVTLPEQAGEGEKRGNSLALIDLANYSLIDLIPAGEDPASIIQSADGRRIFVSNFKADSISIFE
jgi:DNA-binding beta-propeller fold protein YncE